jgi:hypothetical protein
MHVGHPGHIDIPFTVTKRRSTRELMEGLPLDSPERSFVQEDAAFRKAFPDGDFHCWGLPPKAEPAFERTRLGDLILFAPWIGIHDGGIHQLGLVKAKCPARAYAASRILWPKTPQELPYPWLVFFDTEVGRRPWHDFLDDLGFAENWNPIGWYRRLQERRFLRWGGIAGYLEFLRSQCGFRPI